MKRMVQYSNVLVQYCPFRKKCKGYIVWVQSSVIWVLKYYRKKVLNELNRSMYICYIQFSSLCTSRNVLPLTKAPIFHLEYRKIYYTAPKTPTMIYRSKAHDISFWSSISILHKLTYSLYRKYELYTVFFMWIADFRVLFIQKLSMA